MMELSGLKFEYPEAAWLFILAPLLVILYVRLWDYRKSQNLLFFSELTASTMLRRRSTIVFWVKLCAFFMLWCSLIIALMNPQANPHLPPKDAIPKAAPKVQRQQAQDVYLLIDASVSMSVRDARGGVSRLDEAKDIAEQLIQELKGQNVAVYAFTTDTTVLSPPTPDYLYTTLAVRSIELNEGGSAGTSFTKALLPFLEIARKASQKGKKNTVVILSDGEDPNVEKTSSNLPLEDMLKKIADLKKLGWQFYTVSIGSDKGGIVPDVVYENKIVTSRREDALLKSIATTGGGQFFQGSKESALALAQAITKSALSTGKTEEGEQPQPMIYDSYFGYFVLSAAVCCLFILLFPDYRKEES